jgi:diguanylate cyclase (GGDEF)-like protein
VILPSTDAFQAKSMMNRLKAILASTPVSTEEGSFLVQFSYGIASVFNHHIDSPSALLKFADKALYTAKQKKDVMPHEDGYH